MTVFGTRPEIIRLCLVIRAIDPHTEQVLVHTGQNYTPELSDVFLDELGIRAPDIHLGVRARRFAEQAAMIIDRADDAMVKCAPDRVLILGDTNSGLAALPAARRGIPVFHLEAGNRCYDDRVPEEINRRVIDHCSTVLMPYTQRSKDNLCREGIDRERIFVVGNPIFEVLNAFGPQINASRIHERLGLAPGTYLLATMHRSENIDDPDRLGRLISALEAVAVSTGSEIIWPIHPHSLDRLGKRQPNMVRLIEPLGLFDFVRLERDAACVITDSGTVQEECSIFRIPNVTIRDVTERPETIEAGSNILAGSEAADVVRAVTLATSLGTEWEPPSEYLTPRPSLAIAKVVLGRISFRRHES